MNEYLVTMCKRDGSTPLGQCPEATLIVDDITPGIMNTYQRVLVAFYELYPEYDIVSWGRKDQIEAYRQR